MRLLGRLFVVAALVGVGVAMAQQQPDVVVTTQSQDPNDWANTVGNMSWAAAALGCVNRFLTVLERVVTDTRGWADRWLDKTGGKFITRHDVKKTVQTIPWGEQDPDRTGPIPVQHNRRSTDRNGGNVEPFDDSDH